MLAYWSHQITNSPNHLPIFYVHVYLNEKVVTLLLLNYENLIRTVGCLNKFLGFFLGFRLFSLSKAVP